MNNDLFTAGTRALYGDPDGPLHSAWRRNVVQASARHAPRRAGALALGTLLATVALAAFGAVTLGASSIEARAAIQPARSGAEATLARHHAQAVQAFRAQRYAIAYGAFATLADAGHAPSAALALTLVSQGAWLLGGQWSATPGQLLRWNALAQHDLYEHASELSDHDRGE